MGLDMYLKREKYYFNEELPVINGFEDLECCIVVFEGITWRKANAIHNWFVQNVQEGVDDCRKYFVAFEQLHELLYLTTKLLNDKNKAKDILPTVDGCFFGETDYDEEYWQDIEYTQQQLIKILEHPDAEKFSYY